MVGNGIPRALIASVVYFALTFGAGFCFALIRIPFLEPRLGSRWAELIELPAMIVVIVFACRWTLRRLAVPPNAGARLVMGSAALALMLTAEFGLVLSLRGMTIEQYFATRDPVSGAAYYLSLLFFAALPSLVGRRI